MRDILEEIAAFENALKGANPKTAARAAKKLYKLKEKIFREERNG